MERSPASPERKMTAMTRFFQVDGKVVQGTYRPLAWQTMGLSYTQSGYGRKIPTAWIVQVGSRKHRVYVCQYSNNGTAYICRGGKGLSIQNIVISY